MKTINDQRYKRPSVCDLGPATQWFCSACKAHGPATFGKDETVAGAVAKIRAAHQKASPDCKGGTSYIRLVSPEWLKEKGLVA